jgi:hypothetical protein
MTANTMGLTWQCWQHDSKHHGPHVAVLTTGQQTPWASRVSADNRTANTMGLTWQCWQQDDKHESPVCAQDLPVGTTEGEGDTPQVPATHRLGWRRMITACIIRLNLSAPSTMPRWCRGDKGACLHVLLTSALYGGEGSVPPLGRALELVWGLWIGGACTHWDMNPDSLVVQSAAQSAHWPKQSRVQHKIWQAGFHPQRPPPPSSRAASLTHNNCECHLFRPAPPRKRGRSGRLQIYWPLSP